MLYTIVAFVLMGGAAVGVARAFPFNRAIGVWFVCCAIIGALSALALMSQPIGQGTTVGRIGSLFLRWGFIAGRGKLFTAVVISWFVWALIGTAIIRGVQASPDYELQFMLTAWVIDILALMYVVGLVLARRSRSMLRGLMPVMATLAGMLAVSAFQWANLLPGGRHAALLIAGGVPLFVASSYALFLLAMLTFGRNARWN